MNFDFQNSQIQQQNISASEQGTATTTGNYTIPPEHAAAVEEMTRRVKEEIEKPEPSIQNVLNELMSLAWKNTPAFLAMLKMWVFK